MSLGWLAIKIVDRKTSHEFRWKCSKESENEQIWNRKDEKSIATEQEKEERQTDEQAKTVLYNKRWAGHARLFQDRVVVTVHST